MENDIEEKLRDYYKRLDIRVNFVEFRLYDIIVKMEYKGDTYGSVIRYKYKADKTLAFNAVQIIDIINNEIILPFYMKF